MEETWVIPDTLLDTSLKSLDLFDDDIDSYVPTPSSSPTQTEVEPIQTELEPTPSHSPTEVEPTEEERPQPRPPMRGPCGAQCRRKCTDHISDDRRKEILRQYWDMTYTERRTWMFHSVTSLETKSLYCRESTWLDVQLQATRPERRAKTGLQDVLPVNAGLPPKK